MSVRKLLRTHTLMALGMALVATTSPVVLTGCGGGGGGESALTNATEQIVTPSENQTTPQAEVATLSGSLPDDIVLGEGADTRGKVEGVLDVVAICDGQTIDGYFKSDKKHFVVPSVPVGKSCVIAFIDRKVTEGENVPEDAKVLAATPAVSVKAAGEVSVDITAVNDNGVAEVEQTDEVEINTQIEVSKIVGKKLSEAIQVIAQEQQQGQGEQQQQQQGQGEQQQQQPGGTSENATSENATGENATAPAGVAVGNVDTGWLDKRVVGFGVDGIVKDILGKNTTYGSIDGYVKVGDYVYLFDATNNKVYAIDVKNGKKVDVNVIKDGNNYAVDISNVLVDEDAKVVWIEESDNDIMMYKLSDTVDENGKLVINVYDTNENTNAVGGANKLTSANFIAKKGYLIQKVDTAIKAGQFERFWYDEATDSVKTARVDVDKSANANNWIEYIDENTLTAYIDTTGGSISIGTTANADHLYVITWDDANKKYVASESSKALLSFLDDDGTADDDSSAATADAIGGVKYVGKKGDYLLYEVSWYDDTTTAKDYLHVIVMNKNGQLKSKAKIVDRNDADNTPSGITKIVSKVTDGGYLISANDLANDLNAVDNIAFVQIKNDGTLATPAVTSAAPSVTGAGGAKGVGDVADIIPLSDTKAFFKVTGEGGFLAEVGLGGVVVDDKTIAADIGYTAGNTNFVGFVDKTSVTGFVEDTGTKKIARVYHNGQSWKIDNNGNAEGSFNSAVNIQKIIDADSVIVKDAGGNYFLVTYDATNNKFAEKKYDGISLAFSVGNNDDPINSIGASTTNALYKITPSNNPYINTVVFETPHDGTAIKLLGTDYALTKDTRSTDLVYLNTSDDSDAVLVKRLLKDVSISRVFAAGDKVYVVDSNNNLYIVDGANGFENATDPAPIGNFPGSINDVVAKEDGSVIFVASAGNNNFFKVLDANGNQKQSVEVKVALPNGVDPETALTNLRLAYAGDYLYVLGVVDDGAILVTQNTTYAKDFVYVVTYKVNEDGSVTKVAETKLSEVSDNGNTPATYFAKVVGSGADAKLYVAFKDGNGIDKVAQISLANPESPVVESVAEISSASRAVLSSQAIVTYTPVSTNDDDGNAVINDNDNIDDYTVQKYSLPGLAASTNKSIKYYLENVAADSDTLANFVKPAYAFGNYFFAGYEEQTNRHDRIAIIDISNINAPRLAGDIDLTNMGLDDGTGTAGTDKDLKDFVVKAVGDKTYLYAGTEAGLFIIDLNSKTVQ